LIQISEMDRLLQEDAGMSVETAGMDDATLHAALLQQPAHVLFPPPHELSPGFAEAGWRAAMQASNEHLIPRALTLGFKVAAGDQERPENLLDALLVCLRLHANVLAGDREVAAMVLQPGVAEQLPAPLLGRLLDAVPHQLCTIARPQVEVRLEASSLVVPAALRAVGCTRLTVIDRADGDGVQLLKQGQQAGFTACYYQLRAPAHDDATFLSRLQQVLELAPERIVLPAPCSLPAKPAVADWLQAWRLLRVAGYQALGGDHYQRADLPMPLRNGDGQRHCDLMGVPRRERHDLLGIGPGACSQIGDVICRMEAQPAHWRACLVAGQPGVAAGLILSEHERMTDEVVQSLACDHCLDMGAFEWRNALPLNACFEDGIARIALFMERGWLRHEHGVLRIENEGELLWRMIAACFRPLAAV